MRCAFHCATLTSIVLVAFTFFLLMETAETYQAMKHPRQSSYFNNNWVFYFYLLPIDLLFVVATGISLYVVYNTKAYARP